MSDISSRLKGSLRLDAFNGDSHERAICVMQVRQAVKELDRLAARVRELEAVVLDLADWFLDDDTREHMRCSIPDCRTCKALESSVVRELIEREEGDADGTFERLADLDMMDEREEE